MHRVQIASAVASKFEVSFPSFACAILAYSICRVSIRRTDRRPHRDPSRSQPEPEAVLSIILPALLLRLTLGAEHASFICSECGATPQPAQATCVTSRGDGFSHRRLRQVGSRARTREPYICILVTIVDVQFNLRSSTSKSISTSRVSPRTEASQHVSPITTSRSRRSTADASSISGDHVAASRRLHPPPRGALTTTKISYSAGELRYLLQSQSAMRQGQAVLSTMLATRHQMHVRLLTARRTKTSSPSS